MLQLRARSAPGVDWDPLPVSYVCGGPGLVPGWSALARLHRTCGILPRSPGVLYTPIAIGFATLLGSPLATGLLVGINYSRMGYLSTLPLFSTPRISEELIARKCRPKRRVRLTSTASCSKRPAFKTHWQIKFGLVCAKILLAAFLVGCATSLERAHPDKIVTKTHYVIRIGGELVSAPDALTGAGWLGGDNLYVEETNRIPLILEHGFEVTFCLPRRLSHLEFVDLEVSYPKMSSGRKEFPGFLKRKQKVQKWGDERIVYFAFYFDFPWEFVEGQWTITIKTEDALLASTTLYTYTP